MSLQIYEGDFWLYHSVHHNSTKILNYLQKPDESGGWRRGRRLRVPKDTSTSSQDSLELLLPHLLLHTSKLYEYSLMIWAVPFQKQHTHSHLSWDYDTKSKVTNPHSMRPCFPSRKWGLIKRSLQFHHPKRGVLYHLDMTISVDSQKPNQLGDMSRTVLLSAF